MIRIKISNFIKKHKDKIRNLFNKLVIVAVVVLAATIILSAFKNLGNTEPDNIKNVYKPTQSVISGSEISKEQFEEDKNLVNTFLELCNNGKIEEAYNLLSDECKEERYPVIELFKKNYINTIFARKRQCNLQAWISTSNYVVYRVRYTNNMLTTGTYDENDIYEDYITLNRKSNTEKIAIGNFVDSEKCNIVTKTDELEATVVKKMQYVSFEEYEINIKNNTDKTILLDNLKNNQTIQLKVTSGAPYVFDMNRLFVDDLIIQRNRVITVTLRFMKDLDADNTSKEIIISNIIRDYRTYMQDEENYTDVTSINIKVED